MLKGFTAFPDDFAKKYRDAGYWEDQTLSVTFKQVCDTYNDRIAVSDGSRDVTYGQVDQRATNLALNFLDAGLEPGQIVVLQLGNIIEFVYVYFALQKIGVLPILALHSHRYWEMKQFVEQAGAVATITADKTRSCSFTDIVNQIEAETDTLRLKFVLGEVPEGFISLDDLIERPATRDAAIIDTIQRNINPAEPALFLLSGGTTAIPKLIPRTHNDYVCNSKLAAKYTGIDQDSVLLDVLPIAHNLPLACPGLQGFMLKGAKVILHTSTKAEDVFRLIEQHKVTHVHVVPALLINWMNHPLVSEHDLSSVRVIQSGGQRLQPETRLLTERILTNCTVQENFGMAEGLLMFVRLDDPSEIRLETVGRPVCADDEILILGEDDQPVQFGEIGELCCRGPYTLRGYFNAPEHNARAFTPDGFYRSGDLVRQHASGNYIIEGRKKDVINRGGEKISAEEVENLVLTHPAVKNVACVAMPDMVLGEKMCACVILKNGESELTLDELTSHLREQRIATFKLPERLELFDQFPLSTFGKVSKNVLADIIRERSEPISEAS